MALGSPVHMREPGVTDGIEDSEMSKAENPVGLKENTHVVEQYVLNF